MLSPSRVLMLVLPLERIGKAFLSAGPARTEATVGYRNQM